MATHNGLNFITTDPQDRQEQEQVAQLTTARERAVKKRLVHIANALTDPSHVKTPLIDDESKEKLADPQDYWYKALMRAVENGMDADEAFLTLPHDLDQLAVAIPSFYAYDTNPYRDSGLLVPRTAGRLAIMATGDHGGFKESKNSAGLYLTEMRWATQSKKYLKLLEAIQSDAPYGITNFGHMTAGHTMARDLQCPDGVPRTNYSATDGIQWQNHPELDGIRPGGWFPRSNAGVVFSGFNGGYDWVGAVNSGLGVRVAGELEQPQA